MICLDESLLNKSLTPREIDELIKSHKEIIAKVLSGDYGATSARGWFSVRDNSDEALLEKISARAGIIRQDADVFVLVGVGGSNRSAQSIIEGLGYNKKNKPQIIYMGNTLSSADIQETLESLEGKSVYVNVIAKNFATLEPGLAFRMLREWMLKEYGSGYTERLTLTGSYGGGQLAEIAESKGFSFFEFPAAVNGRFSAFTTVAFLPMAVMGADIRKFIEGAESCEKRLKNDPTGGIAARYAAIRHLLQKKGYIVESLSYFEPSLEKLGRWWLQLHGETEGKTPEAILPILSCYSEDLHAIGQYYQEGGRFIFETFLNFFKPSNQSIPISSFGDGFSALDGKSLNILNPAVAKATAEAHYEAGIPVLKFNVEKVDEESLAEFMYMQMLSTCFSTAFLGIEPYEQNGVDLYKNNLRRELGISN
jgi:glucose-6-phosphate isomerase